MESNTAALLAAPMSSQLLLDIVVKRLSTDVYCRLYRLQSQLADTVEVKAGRSSQGSMETQYPLHDNGVADCLGTD